MPKAAIYNPNWDSLGGGERYSATVAKVLESCGFKVDIWWPTNLATEIKSRFGIDLNCKFIDFNPAKTNLFNKLVITSKYDFIFWVSDGSIPISLAKKTLIHFQIPFVSKNAASPTNKLKAKLYTSVCNSYYTKKFVDQTYGINSDVLYPPVDTDNKFNLPKSNTIVSIARFSTLLHSKNQDLLINAFKIFEKSHPDWKLVLAGGSQDETYLQQLKILSTGSNIEFVVNPTESQIKQILATGKVFWSATGINNDPVKNPEKMEHFGITVVEAMSAGCVPVVSAMGGHLETVSKDIGMVFSTIEELVESTKKLVSSPEELKRYMANGLLQCKKFDTRIFAAKMEKYISK